MYFPILEYLHKWYCYKFEDSNELFYPVPKNGHSTMNHCCHTNGMDRVKLLDMDSNEEYKVTIFLREPLDRFWSAFETAFRTYFLNKPVIASRPVLDFARKAVFIDRHVFPQLFYLMRLYDDCPNSTITFYDYKDIGEVFKTDVQMNPTNPKNREDFKQLALDHYDNLEDRMRVIYQPDMIMWKEFIGKTLHFDEIRDRLRESEHFYDKFTIGKDFL